MSSGSGSTARPSPTCSPRGRSRPNVASSITSKIADAVAEAHRNGIALGALHPALIRVNFDGQVRLSHVIAHGSATPDQDIRSVGALLYLMLTGTWPLAETVEKGPPARCRQPRPTAVARCASKSCARRCRRRSPD